MPEPLALHSLNHIARPTMRLETSRRFYREVLGFREVSRPNFSFRGAWLYQNGLMIHLIERDAGGAGGTIDTRAEHVAFHVDDLEAAARTVEAHGIEYRRNEIADRGIKQIFFHDPDGHHIELGTYPPTPPYVE